MLNNLKFKKKEIYYYGAKEVHNVLCVEFLTDNCSYWFPVYYSSKGKDGKYYNTYIIKDSVDEVEICSLLNLK